MDVKQNAIIFCEKAKIPGYMQQVVGWLADSFNLYYRHMPFEEGSGLSWAWGGIKDPIAYVFIILDLKVADQAIITRIIKGTEQELEALLEGPDDQLPSSFRLVLNIKTADSFESEDEDEEPMPPFNPCLITFSKDYLGSLGDRLDIWGVNLHINQSDDIFHDRQKLLETIATKAVLQAEMEEIYKSTPGEY